MQTVKLQYDTTCADCGASLHAGEEARRYGDKYYCAEPKHKNPTTHTVLSKPQQQAQASTEIKHGSPAANAYVKSAMEREARASIALYDGYVSSASLRDLTITPEANPIAIKSQGRQDSQSGRSDVVTQPAAPAALTIEQIGSYLKTAIEQVEEDDALAGIETDVLAPLMASYFNALLQKQSQEYMLAFNMLEAEQHELNYRRWHPEVKFENIKPKATQ